MVDVVITTTGTHQVAIVTEPDGDRQVVRVPVDQVLQNLVGPQGPQGPPGTSQPFTHSQTSASATWVIDHPLNRKPNVLLIVDGQEVFADVFFPSNSRVTVVFPSPVTGEANLL